MTVTEANELLPQTKVGAQPDPLRLIYTLIAEPKWGKTTWMCQIPNSLLLAFEKGHSFVEAHKINITAWKERNPKIEVIEGVHHMTFSDAVDIICASDQFDFVIFDTADMAAKMCLDYHLKHHGLTHQQDWDFGKGSDVCLNTPFRQAVNRLAATGRGVGFITHTEVRDARFASGNKARKECSLPTGLIKYVIPMSDLVLHGKFGGRNKATGRRERIIVTEGSDDMLAGSRVQGQFRLPSQFVVDPTNPWGQWASFFNERGAAEAAEAEAASSTRTDKPDGEENPPAEPPPKRVAKKS